MIVSNGTRGPSGAQVRKNGRWFHWLALLGLLGVAILAKGYWNATRDTEIRTATVHAKDWPKGQPPLRLLLISDIHVAGPDMPPERLRLFLALLVLAVAIRVAVGLTWPPAELYSVFSAA